MNSQIVAAWMYGAADAVARERRYLTQLDAAIGDADHGDNLSRGFDALALRLDTEGVQPLPGLILVTAGQTLSIVGGASGALWECAFRRAGEWLGDVEEFDEHDLEHLLSESLAAIFELGAAREGDKTMVDAFAPAVRTLRKRLRRGVDLGEALVEAREASLAGMRSTAMLQARKGRASYVGSRSIGHVDPGATSTALVFGALVDAVTADRARLSGATRLLGA